MKFSDYHLERPRRDLEKLLSVYSNAEQKTAIWNAFVDSELSGITDDDFSVVPRALPASYFPMIVRSARLITEFTMKLLSLPEDELRAIVPKGPIRDYLIDDLQVLKHRNGRITGSYRFDMAIVGPPDKKHAPQLLEINEIGFDGLARSTFFQNTLLSLMPDLKKRFINLDTAKAEIQNMRRLGHKIARVQSDNYNWDEEFLLRKAKEMKADLRLISPAQFGLDIDEEYPLLLKKRISIKNQRAQIGDWRPDAMNMSFAYTLKDYREGHHLYRKLVASKTPQYGPFLTGLVASKTVLVLLADPYLQRRLMGSTSCFGTSVLPAQLLNESELTRSQMKRDWVLKFADGFGGQQVYMNDDLLKQIKKIRKEHEWVLQKKTKLNLIEINGILSRPKRAIADLGVFVEYDWHRDHFKHFEVGGLMARATNKSLKVNVSSGGAQAAVLLDRKS